MTGSKKQPDNLAHQWLSSLSKNPLHNAPDNFVVQQYAARKWLRTKGIELSSHESWKYSTLTNLFEHIRGTAPERDFLCADFHQQPSPFDAYQLVFVNGYYRPYLSQMFERGVTIKPFSAERVVVRALLGEIPVVDAGDALAAVNIAYGESCWVIKIAPGTRLAKPLHIHHELLPETPSMVQPRVLFVIGEGADITIIETIHATATEVWLNALTEVDLAPRANVNYIRWYDKLPFAAITNQMIVRAHEQSCWNDWLIAQRTAYQRLTLDILLQGHKAQTNVHSLALGAGVEQADVYTLIDHQEPETKSTQSCKFVVDNRAMGVFDGTVRVRETAPGSTARQSNRNLLMSPTAQVVACPHLDILTDDVQCTHGSATGALDEESVFYLRSRGIAPDEAERLVLQGFMYDTIESVPHQGLKNFITKQLLP